MDIGCGRSVNGQRQATHVRPPLSATPANALPCPPVNIHSTAPKYGTKGWRKYYYYRRSYSAFWFIRLDQTTADKVCG
jgi:hypothetical protein